MKMVASRMTTAFTRDAVEPFGSKGVWPATCGISLTIFNKLLEVRKMFVCQVLLFAGGFVTTLFAVSVICPVRKDQPITGC